MKPLCTTLDGEIALGDVPWIALRFLAKVVAVLKNIKHFVDES
jgi:hypothetical protein